MWVWGVRSQRLVAAADASTDPGAVVIISVHAAVADGAVVRAQPLECAAPLAPPARRARPFPPSPCPAGSDQDPVNETVLTKGII